MKTKQEKLLDLHLNTIDTYQAGLTTMNRKKQLTQGDHANALKMQVELQKAQRKVKQLLLPRLK